MKLNVFISVAVAFLTVALVADEPLVTNVDVQQRWPWSPKVDIDYMYTGNVATTLLFTATWRGQAEPVNLVSLADTGTFSVTPGQHRFTWDPVAAGYGDATLQDFRVTIEPGQDPRTYLVLDLIYGGYTFLADVPAGGWTDKYKSTLMVFRRIPAGTYTLGTAEADIVNVTGSFDKGDYTGCQQYAKSISATPRTVTLTSDYYFSVFLITGYQFNLLQGKSGTSNYTPLYQISDANGGASAIRGWVQDDGATAVDWPSTGYRVKSSSVVGRARSMSSVKGQPELRIDLATDAQWEIAMRAGTTTFFPNGGTKDSASEDLKALFGQIAQAKWDTGKDPWAFNVGLKDSNSWGIYDFGVRSEVVLDYANDQGSINGNWPYIARNLSNPAGGVDPIGPTTAPTSNKYRVRRSCEPTGSSWGKTSLASVFTAVRTTTQMHQTGSTVSAYNVCWRLAIHLKPLVDVE